MPEGQPGGRGLWERTRVAVRAEISETAMRLFLQRGFAATTIDDIAAEAGISRRSLLRYFGTKEDIVLGHLDELGHLLKAELESRPDAEPPWDALRAALAALPAANDDPQRMLSQARMMLETPSLRARNADKHLSWQALLVPEIERRMGIRSGPVPDPRAHALVGCALACLHTATEIWTLRDGDGDLGDIYDEAVAAVREQP